MDYCQFMRDARRDNGSYKYRDVLGITDPAELIKQVRTRGYCTDPTYDYSIVKIIAKHNLTQYDIEEDKPMHEIIDITAENHAPRRTLPIKYIVMHYLGVPNADNPYLYNGGYGGHYNVTRRERFTRRSTREKALSGIAAAVFRANGGSHVLWKVHRTTTSALSAVCRHGRKGPLPAIHTFGISRGNAGGGGMACRSAHERVQH